MMALDALLAGKEPTLEDDADVDLTRLSAADRDAILARVTPDDSAPPDAFALTQNEIRREMIDRGIQPKGFYNDDAARLQEEFNREHAAEKEARMTQKLQFAAKTYLKETVHRRRMERERELREEVAEIAQDPRLEVWLDLAKRNETPTHATLRLSSIGTRALGKSLVLNHSLQSLSLSRNALDDAAGKYLALLLKRNTTLKRLDVDANHFGPLTAKELADALTHNATLEYLNLESNPLTDDEKDMSGIAALANMLTQNSTLRTLNLWRTRLGTDGGKIIAQGVEKNTTLLCVDVGNNRIAAADGVRIDTQLKKNRRGFDAFEGKQIAVRQAQLTAAEQERGRQQALRKQAEHEQWIEERKLERQEERARQDAQRERQRQEEEDRQRQLAARKAAEFAAKLEMEKKKKKKKGGGKKKKK
ncbi:hypothetical protein Poli38472_014532 [Pythium oligandrum]|uniref:Uncharacterized protein n=1 Tax=Pythium oligandrum TaxID=41045 RepID=A0A8K1CCX8_PYTOL|nr:hypothetical protein Poli38472_014532 [Pythium oligandrum]|eukprot:TMW61071.1 hypothetical protein Poli38472_014532 [Pythium oligandrum]